MSPLDRLSWLRAIAMTEAPSCAWKVAAVLAEHTNASTGLSWPGLRNAIGIDSAKRGARWLVEAKWIEAAESLPGKPTVYRLTRGSVAPGAVLPPVQDSSHTRGRAAPGPQWR